MDVSIIIVNYNTKTITNQCIDSVVEMTKGVIYEIILVDNGSTDGSAELFSLDSRINFIESGSNLGFGRANNLGYKYSSGKYILLLNSDTILLNDAITEFYRKMEQSNPDVACIGAYLVDRELKPNQSFGHFLSISRVLKNCITTYLRVFGIMKTKNINFWKSHSDWMEVEIIIGADLFIKRHVIEKLGLFDETFFMYHEENDMQRRFALKGYKQALVLGPKIVHLEQASSLKMSTINKKIMADVGLFNYMRNWTTSLEFYFFKYTYILLKIPILIDKCYPFTDALKYLGCLMTQRYRRVTKTSIL